MRRWIETSVLGSALLLAAATPLSAQTSGGFGGAGGLPDPRLKVETPDVRHSNRMSPGELQREFDVRYLSDPVHAAELHGYADAIAKCIMKRGGDNAASFLGGQLVGDPAYERIGKALTGRMRRCADTDQGATALAISGSLAEQLLAARSPHFEDRAPAVSEEEAGKFFGDLQGQVTFDNVAGCLAVYSPGLAFKVVQSEAGSKDETAAIEALYKQTPECGLSTTPTSIPVLYQRGALATALYEWSTRKS
jgi:hypothetical protein